MSDQYSVVFSAEGSVLVLADSPEDAEKQAIEAIETASIWGTESSDIDGCTVRVSMRFVYDEETGEPDKCEGVDRAPKVVEFA